jgi:hypothetical protein
MRILNIKGNPQRTVGEMPVSEGWNWLVYTEILRRVERRPKSLKYACNTSCPCTDRFNMKRALHLYTADCKYLCTKSPNDYLNQWRLAKREKGEEEDQNKREEEEEEEEEGEQ